MSEQLTKYEPSHALANIEINTEILEKLQGFQKQFLHKLPDPKEVRTNKQANDSNYLPISFLEMNLDEIFFGLWQTKNFNAKVVANEIVGEIELWYFHPTAKTWICRIGAGAVMIQQKSGAEITDLGAKYKNTLTKDYPHLKAECFRNACLSIGKAFGRDLNRDFEDQYKPIIATPKEPNIVNLKQELIDILDKRNDKIELKRQLRGIENEGKLSVDVLNEWIKKYK